MTFLFRILPSLILILKNFELTMQLKIINAALNRPALDCANRSIPELTDGNKNRAFVIVPRHVCTNTIILDKPYNILYMKIYLGDGYEEMEDHPLDMFSFYLELSDAKYKYCGTFQRKINLIKDRTLGIAINCIASNFKYNEPKMYVFDGIKYNITEMEVYTFDEDMDEIMIHRGCYKRFPKGNFETKFINISNCHSTCTEQQSTALLAINQKKRKCKCLADYNEKLETDLEKCDVLIPGSDFYGGGDGTYSLYLTIVSLPKEVGCTDDLRSITKYEISNMSVVKCANACQNYPLIWIQKSVCGCRNERFVLTDSRPCNIPCPGGDEYYCGGDTHASVYTTCLNPKFKSPPCSKLFQCKDGLFNELGHCLKGCKENYSLEPFCIERKTYETTTTPPRSEGSTQRLTLIQSCLFFLAELMAFKFSL